MSTNSFALALGAGAITVALSMLLGVAPNVAAPLGLLIGGIIAVFQFVNTPAPLPAVPVASPPAKKSKKAAKKEVVKRPPTPVVEDESSSSDASASEVSEDDAEENLSKNAKKKAKKKQKEAEAKAAAAAAAKKAEEEKKKAAKKAAPAPTPAPPAAKKEEAKKGSKKAKEEKKPAATPVPAPRTPSPPPQQEEEEEEFQTSKASKKKAKQDAKKAEKKEVDVTPTPAPAAKKSAPAADPAPVSPAITAAPAPAPKKAEKKAAAAAAPAPVVEKVSEDDGWETAKAAKPTIAQKQAAKVANAEKKVVEETVNIASDVYSEFVDIPARAIPAIIGSKGAVLKALQEGTQAKIEIPPASARAIDSLTVRVIVSGEPDAVRYAKTCVKSLAEKGFSAVTHPGFVSDDIYVESKQHGLIIGPKGTTLKTIQTKSGTRIQMPERGGNDRVLIVGPKEGVKAAKEAIKQLIADGFSAMTHEGTEKKEIPYPREKIGWLIGANGQTIKSIQGNTKCKINIPRDNASFVTIVGPAAGIAQAEKEILRTLEPKVKKGKKDGDDEVDVEEKEAEAEATETDGPQGAYDAWTQAETATTEDQLWQ